LAFYFHIILPLLNGYYIENRLKLSQGHIYYYDKIKFTYVPVLQDTIQGTHDLAASLALFSNADQQYEAHNLGYGSSHGVQGTQSCAIPPFQYNNL